MWHIILGYSGIVPHFYLPPFFAVMFDALSLGAESYFYDDYLVGMQFTSPFLPLFFSLSYFICFCGNKNIK